MRIVLLLIIAITIFSVATANMEMEEMIMKSVSTQSLKEQFKVYHLVTKKSYNLNSEEGIMRYKNFKSNLKFIEESNAQNKPYTLGINDFTDMSWEEFKKVYLSNDYAEYQNEMRQLRDGKSVKELLDEMEVIIKQIRDTDPSPSPSPSPAPVAFPDWSENYGPARSQGQCGSCWAFATAGTIEGWFSIKNREYQQLSTQQLVSCERGQGGCQGGHPSRTGKYESQTGIVLESAYPYTSGNAGDRGECNDSVVSRSPKMKISKYRYCEPNSRYRSRKCAAGEYASVMKRGPIYVAIEANRSLMSYKSGVWEGACNGGPNHAVINVQTTDSTVKIRNSWGSRWGDSGYVLVKRDPQNNNSCFVEMSMWYPTL